MVSKSRIARGRDALAAHWPDSGADFQRVPIAPEAQGCCRYDEGGGATWSGPDGHRRLMYFFRCCLTDGCAFREVSSTGYLSSGQRLGLITDHGIQL